VGDTRTRFGLTEKGCHSPDNEWIAGSQGIGQKRVCRHWRRSTAKFGSIGSRERTGIGNGKWHANPLDGHLSRLHQTSLICRTRVQSCWYSTDGDNPSPTEVDRFIASIGNVLRLGARLVSIQLYSLARKPLLPEGAALALFSTAWLIGTWSSFGQARTVGRHWRLSRSIRPFTVGRSPY